MSMIYSLVARGHETVLSSFTQFSGNFQAIALDVLKKCNLGKTFGQYATVNYSFYTFVKEGIVFLVMVENNYETRIAINFLKKIQEIFFNRYDSIKRNSAVSHSLKDFNAILKEKIELYNDKSKVDKLTNLQQHLTELEEQSLRNMDKVIERGEKIEILVKKSENLSDQSYDLKDTSKKVKRKMWWKNKKILIGIVILIALIIFLIAGAICGFNFKQC